MDVLFNFENASKFQIPSEDNLAEGFSASTAAGARPSKALLPIARKTGTRINLRSKSRFAFEQERTLKAADRRKIERAQRRRNRKDWKQTSRTTLKTVKTMVNQLTRRPSERRNDTI